MDTKYKNGIMLATIAQLNKRGGQGQLRGGLLICSAQMGGLLLSKG